MNFLRLFLLISLWGAGLFGGGLSRAEGAELLTKDIWIGKADAPVKMLEFMAFSCPHCKNFHGDTFVKIKKKYIDTGKVKLLTKPLAQNQLGLKVVMLSRCVQSGQYYDFIKRFLSGQDEWLDHKQVDKLRAQYGEVIGLKMYGSYLDQHLIRMAKEFDLDEEETKNCISDSENQRSILAAQQQLSEIYDIARTPAIYVAGQKVENPTFENIDSAIKAALGRVGSSKKP